MASKTAVELALKKLQSSGLDATDAKALGLDVLDASAMPGVHPSFASNAALAIPYTHPLTGKPLTAAPRWPPFVRYRYLGPAGTLPMIGKKEQRYVQAPNSGVCAYFPSNIDWKPVLEDANATIYITEGELKAAKACKEGFPTIGLGGVFNFRSNEPFHMFLPELDMIDWAQRKAVLVYDSDIADNSNVQQAASALLACLEERGAISMLLALPAREQHKQGLDDWFVNNPSLSFDELVSDLAQPFGCVKDLLLFNESYAWCENPPLVAKLKSSTLMKAQDFKNSMSSTLVPLRRTFKSGRITNEMAPIYDVWMGWPLRRKLDRMIFAPGLPRLTEFRGETVWNSWSGFAVDAKKGDVKPFLDLVDHLFKRSTAAEKQWFLQWLAFPIQVPGTKHYSAVTLFGGQGVGKSFVFLIVGRVYGNKPPHEHFRTITNETITNQFNTWAINRQFILNDEASAHENREMTNKLKVYISDETMEVQPKYTDKYTVPNHINFAFTSNHADPQSLDDDDRRHFVVDVGREKLGQEFYTRLNDWQNDERNLEALRYYFEHLDLKGFDPRAKPPVTQHKQAVIDRNRTPVQQWVGELRENKSSVLYLEERTFEGVLRVPDTRELMTREQVLKVYLQQHPNDRRTTAALMGNILVEAGIRQLPKTRCGKRTPVLFVVEHARTDYWAKASTKDIAAHHLKHNPEDK